MVVLADEVLESFFETDLSNSFHLEAIPDAEVPTSSSGLLGDLWSTIATDSNKKIFNMFTDEIGKTIGRHQVCVLLKTLSFSCLKCRNTNTLSTLALIQVIHRPSIGRYTKLEEPKARESILSPSMKKPSSKANVVESTSPRASSLAPSSSSTLTVDVKAHLSKDLPSLPPTATLSPVVQAVNARLMERTPFAIDDAKDDDEESEDELNGNDNDDRVMDEASFPALTALLPI